MHTHKFYPTFARTNFRNGNIPVVRMRKTIIGILLVLTAPLYALHVECVGSATILTNNGDTLFLFTDNPHIKTKSGVGAVDWYRLPDTIKPVQEGTDYLYPENGEGYMIKIGTAREFFWVFDYDKLRLQVSQVNADLLCNETQITLVGTVPALSYRNAQGRIVSYPRQCRVTYHDGAWNSEKEEWTDSVAVEQQPLTSFITVGATAVTTDFVITDELAELLAQQFNTEVDTLYSPTYQPVALKAHPTAIVTTRGKEGEMTNEVNRPTQRENTENRSAPLDVLFRANGLNADYYLWYIYKGTNPIVKRTSAEHRYTFTERGNYRTVLYASNAQCSLDSVEFSISVSESMLLVPNVFTPNGDGVNDEFRVAYRSLKEFHCWIYNRWGMLIYEWTDPAKGWDGTINGRPAAEGAYYYVIRALGTDADTNAKYLSKPAYNKARKKQSDSLIGVYQLSGAINLLRGGK